MVKISTFCWNMLFSYFFDEYLNIFNKTWHIYKVWQKGYSYFMVTLKSKHEIMATLQLWPQ